MSIDIPLPLNALRAVEIVARTRALAPAAEILGVTPGAVSQHIRRAEERLGVVLFERTSAGLLPSAELERILPQLSEGFRALAAATASLTGARDRSLTVTLGNVFASRWLVWRNRKFSELNPGIELRLVVTGDVIDLGRSDIDCGIRFGTGDWPGVRSQRLGGFTYRPVAAPELAAEIGGPADLGKFPVIRDQSSMLDWSAWWRAAGITNPPVLRGPVYSDPALAFDAAISGQGVLLAVDMMSADCVSDGRLVRPFAATAESEMGYWLATDANRSLSANVRKFVKWLEDEIPASACGYVGQLPKGQPRLVNVPSGDSDAAPLALDE